MPDQRDSRARVLITGASSGVGRSLVDHLKGRFEVIAVARRVERMREFFGDDEVHCYGIDLAERSAIAELDEVLERHAPVLNVINNAGMGGSWTVEDLSTERLHRVMAVNAYAPLHIMRAVLGDMVENDYGRIINVTSGAPLNCFAGHAAYSQLESGPQRYHRNSRKGVRKAQHQDQSYESGSGPNGDGSNAAMDPSVCHDTADYLLGLNADGPTGRFFWLGHEIPLFPNLDGIDWLGGTASEAYPRIS